MQFPPLQLAPVNYAHWGWRVLASAVDSIVLYILSLVIFSIVPIPGTATLTAAQAAVLASVEQGQLYFWWEYDGFWAAFAWSVVVSSALFITYHTIMLASWGATVGKFTVGLQVVPETDLDAPRLSVSTALIRSTSYRLMGYVPVLNLIDAISPLWREKRKSLHDSIAKTVVRKVS